ncbi:MAG: helix-turn-helix transcriptional regulator [Tetrasphaera sp.]
MLNAEPFRTAAATELDKLASPSPLSPREREVVALVAEGLSNAAIAEQFTLSERTIESHVSSILRKLDLTSRVGIATWHTRG